MREINECTAEVFRRSEKRIKERKRNRNCILALCIPLCLIITVWSVTILPAILPVGNAAKENAVKDNAINDAAAEGVVEEIINGSYFCSYTEVVIRNANDTYADSQEITDKVEITKIYSAILTLYDEVNGDEPVDAEADDMENAGFADQSSEAESRLNGCVITFRTEDSLETVYTLDGNELLNVDKNMKIILMDSQIAELKEVLGISE